MFVVVVVVVAFGICWLWGRWRSGPAQRRCPVFCRRSRGRGWRRDREAEEEGGDEAAGLGWGRGAGGRG